jgi:hypothetical protein
MPFDDVYAEDGIWVEKAVALAKTESFIDLVVCKYNWDEYVTSDPKYRKEKSTEVPRHVRNLLPFLRR